MKPAIDPNRCQACGDCVRACPFGCLELFDIAALVRPQHCEGEGACAAACPHGALEMQ